MFVFEIILIIIIEEDKEKIDILKYKTENLF